jgi:hypothetical protein
MNRRNHSEPAPATRPLPKVLPEFVPVELRESHYNGQPQWVATYRVYDNGIPSDYVDFVVNIPRHIRPWPVVGEYWWVKPTNMAAQKRLIFAEAHTRVDGHMTPPDVRTNDELTLKFDWSQNDRYHHARHGDWSVVLRDAHICTDESWQVRVVSIHPRNGVLEVSSIGPLAATHYEPPVKVGLMSVTPIFGRRETIESDLYLYYCWSTRRGGYEFQAKIMHNDRISTITCTELRKQFAGWDTSGKKVEKVVGRVSQDNRRVYLAELVLVEGEISPMPRRSTPDPAFEQPDHGARSKEPKPSELEPDDGWDIVAQEERENGQPSEW